jgi:hypothetical protein
MMSTCCSKHVEAENKYFKKECIKLVITQKFQPSKSTEQTCNGEICCVGK